MRGNGASNWVVRGMLGRGWTQLELRGLAGRGGGREKGMVLAGASGQMLLPLECKLYEGRKWLIPHGSPVLEAFNKQGLNE